MMAGQEHESLREQIPAYALGCLDGEEAGALARHLETCRECAAELAAYQRVANGLALAVPSIAPSPALRGRLLAEIGGRSRRAARPGKGAPRPLAPRRAWPAFAVLGFAALILGGLLWAAVERLSIGGRTVTLTPTEFAPGASGELRIARDGREATLAVEGLPPLPLGQQYQLWLVDGDTRDSGALFLVNETGAAEVEVALARRAAAYERFGITIEPAGGSPGPTGQRVLGGEY